MTEAIQAINKLKWKVMWRKRLLALQDKLALALLVGGLLSASVVLYARLRPVHISVWALACAISAGVTGVLLARWLITRATERDAAFQIDRALKLEDRFTTAQAILERGGPERAVEMALLEDAAAHVSEARPSSIAPYSLPRWYALSLIGALAVVSAVMVPERALPGGEAAVEARRDIQSAGEQLEQTAAEVQQSIPPEARTAELAKEQADLGRALRRSTDTRAEVLKKLSALEDRIRQRHGELASTRADEIVDLAEQRLRSAVSTPPKDKRAAQSGKEQTETAAQVDQPEGETSTAKETEARSADPEKKPTPSVSTEAKDNKESKGADREQSGERRTAETPQSGKGAQRPEAEPQPDSKKPAAGGEDKRVAGGQSQNSNQSSENAKQAGGSDNTPAPQPSDSKESKDQQKDPGEQKADQQKTEETPPPNPLSGFVAEQAAKALPALSEQLLKKAEQLRAGELKAEDIKRLAQSAEALARDLAPIVQSKEFQQAVEQLARQINPEQIERVARELMNQEGIRRELEAAGRLLMENRQAKEVVAGLAQKAGEFEAQMRPQIERQINQGQFRPDDPSSVARGNGKPDRGGRGSQGRAGSRGQYERIYGGADTTGKGREAKLSGSLQRKPGGEYLFLQARPGTGAARAPYNSAYPQYRREAERSVERSQIPVHMRSLVRKYFDQINPDANKKQ